jgi:hypothetical protein
VAPREVLARRLKRHAPGTPQNLHATVLFRGLAPHLREGCPSLEELYISPAGRDNIGVKDVAPEGKTGRS